MKNDCGIKVVGRIAEGKRRGYTDLGTVSMWWDGGGHIFAVGRRGDDWFAADDEHYWFRINPVSYSAISLASAFCFILDWRVVITRAEKTHSF